MRGNNFNAGPSSFSHRENRPSNQRQRFQEQREPASSFNSSDKQKEFIPRWPAIKVDYEPELWRESYQMKNGENFQSSTEFEAENKLMDILIKVTFVERNLTVNGEQTAEELFENLSIAIKEDQINPFPSFEELASFCDSMTPVFHKDRSTKKYRNTGNGYRKFVEVLKERLELGDEINEDTLDKILSDFIATIKKPTEKLEFFAKKEVFLDFTSLFDLSMNIPAFKYDKEEGRLQLTSEANDRLSLHLPILTDSLDSDHPYRVDTSRKIKTTIRFDEIVGCERIIGTIIRPPLDGVFVVMHKKQFSANMKSEAKTLSITGCICPSHEMNQIMVHHFNTSTISFNNNCSAYKSADTLDYNGRARMITFDDECANEAVKIKMTTYSLRPISSDF